MLTPGAPAPDFAIPSHSDIAAPTSAPTSPTTLHTLAAAQPVLAYFYPADFTPVCTKQACTMRDAIPNLPGVAIVGISPQSADSHARFAEKHNLAFPLVADTDKSIARAYDTLGPFGLGHRRTTYLIAQDHTIAAAARADFSLAKHKALFDRARELASSQ